MSRFAALIERKPSEVPSGAYNGICSRLEDTGSVRSEGKEFIESPVSRARPQLTPDNYQERSSFVNSEREFRLTNSSAPSKRCRVSVATNGGTRAAAGSGESWTCAVDRRPPLTTIPPANMSRWSEAAARKPKWAVSEWPTIHSMVKVNAMPLVRIRHVRDKQIRGLAICLSNNFTVGIDNC
jgi:hypothetical protein